MGLLVEVVLEVTARVLVVLAVLVEQRVMAVQAVQVVMAVQAVLQFLRLFQYLLTTLLLCLVVRLAPQEQVEQGALPERALAAVVVVAVVDTLIAEAKTPLLSKPTVVLVALVTA